MPNEVDHPDHYNWIPGVECIDVVENFGFNIGCAIKYLWRAGRKGSRLVDLRKAAWHINREIRRIEKEVEDKAAQIIQAQDIR